LELAANFSGFPGKSFKARDFHCQQFVGFSVRVQGSHCISQEASSRKRVKGDFRVDGEKISVQICRGNFDFKVYFLS
jgi:hypothetical protein